MRIVQYRLFFGSARAEIREFCEPAEEVWSRAESRSLTEHRISQGGRRRPLLRTPLKARAQGGGGRSTTIAWRIEGEMQSLKKLFPNLSTGPSIHGLTGALHPASLTHHRYSK